MEKQKLSALRGKLTKQSEKEIDDQISDLRNEWNRDIDKSVEEEFQKREKFLLDMIEKHCYWWQKIYVNLAKKFLFLNIWFIENTFKNVPHELNSDFLGLDFGTEQKYGCKINGIIYWMD